MTSETLTNDDIIRMVKNHEIRKLLQERLKSAPIVMLDKHQINFDAEDVDEFYRQKAKEELRETPEIVAQGFKELKELLAEEPDINFLDSEEIFIIFLRTCKWYAQSAFSLMKRFIRFNQNYPNVYKNLKPSIEKTALCAGLIFPLPLRGTDGCRIFIIELGKRWKPKEVSLEQIFKGLILCTHAAMMEPKTQITGGRVILDFEGLSLSQVTYFTPSFAKMVADFVQKAFPLRLKSIHVVNQSFLFNMIFALFKPLLEEKFRKRIHFHGTNWGSLATFINKSVLLKKYGGELDLIDYSFCTNLWQIFCFFDPIFEVFEEITSLPKN
ncbi:PREDICTED: alpha-tocopherol transfer protein-like [Dinoponera quadriceps]|uniref:Alpha-tocopherol transfer protein-like n=1 Tax=Dinoponera quadriceps TaxID=609295 RepID=A0A6P3X323_DINQU|nr:PREDICTED: alpha-tocopherol transfer protein-like [Dinoponera quadriceps]XP_014472761.1 PREDICTED: alpha-tocopherol transfer protein-like [Dinoponera quadriceps]